MNDNSLLEIEDSSAERMMGHDLRDTTKDGSSPIDSRTKFFEAVEEHTDDDFLKRFLEKTVDGTCEVPLVCRGSFEDQLDVFMNCRQPLSMFSFFRESKTRENPGVQVLPAGAYVLPTYCEYCQAAHPSLCPTHCLRPKYYFQKKRPPFKKLDPNRWNPQNDFALEIEDIDEEGSLSDSHGSKDVPTEVSTSASSSNSASNNGPKYIPTEFPHLDNGSESLDTQHIPRQRWLGVFSSRAQPVAN